MENNNIPTSMTTGVAMPINNEEMKNPPEEKFVDQDVQDSAEIVEVEDIEEVSIEDESANTSELLLNAAKEEGFEEALTAFANDELAEKPIMGEETDNNTTKKEKTSEKEKVEKEEDIETEIPQEGWEDERVQLIEKINTLEEKVGELMEETKQLSERVKSAETAAQLSKEMMLEMFALLLEMIRKEEDEKDKVSFLEILVALIGKFMVMLVDPEEEGKKGEKNERPISKKSQTVPNIAQFEKFLKEKEKIRSAFHNTNRPESTNVSIELPFAA